MHSLIDSSFVKQSVKGQGATAGEWQHFAALGLRADLLPVVSDLSVPVHPESTIKVDGKTPSKIDARGFAWGVGAWTKRNTTAAEVDRWARDSRLGIGVIGRQVKAFDIDIADAAIAGAVRDMLELTLGALPCRGRPGTGKKLLMFRLAEPMPKRTITTAHGIVEFLGQGQQFLLAGQHKSGTRYTWEAGLPVDIPTLTREEVDAAWQALAEQFGTGEATTERAAYVMRPAIECDGTDRERDIVVGRWDVDEVDGNGRLHGRCPWWSEHTDPDPDESAGMYIPAAVNGQGHSGYKCFHSHCEKRNVFDFLQAIGVQSELVVDEFEFITRSAEEEAADSITRAKNEKKAASKLPPLVLESGTEQAARTERERSRTIGEGAAPLPVQGVMSGSEMLEDLVFLSEGSRVSRVSDPRFVLTFTDFKATTEASTTFVKSPSGRTLKKANAQLWLEHTERKTVRTQTFAPGRGALCTSPDNVPAQNLWAPRTVTAPVRWRELSAPFFEHVEYLVPVAAERERFLDWLAHIEQSPGVLPSTHYLMVASQTGIGRNWLAYALARAFPGHTALGFDLGAALKSGFNGSLSMKLLAVVDELHEGGPGGAHTAAAERLKSMLTEATRLINPKHGRQHTEFNCARFLMFSNHAAALPLADNDRRVIVIENPSERRSEAYFVHLYALLADPDFGPALAEALRRRDISAFNAGAPAPMTEAKARTIRAGRSEVEQAIRDVAREWPSACITSSRLAVEVAATLGGKTFSVQAACVAAGLVKCTGRVKVAGVPSHVWALRDGHEWRDAMPADIAAEVLRGQHEVDGRDFE